MVEVARLPLVCMKCSGFIVPPSIVWFLFLNLDELILRVKLIAVLTAYTFLIAADGCKPSKMAPDSRL